MDLAAIVKALNLKVRCGEKALNREVKGGYVGDLLSDVIANSQEGHVWITRQVHQNVVAVASLKDLAAVILVQGTEPAPEALEKAAREGIPILVAAEPGFEVAGKIYRLIAP
ncbi:MAG TPA: DRTGG domain-containing protein [Syntrophales bacterium]|nr:DRTGG domain-containing protein [Syntrophales bacterium]HPI57936.1 DRTGG domain-containing protein [Syntrophales bacterium]HPN24585.1 DRTGG domain-containing protein [Syntrophales bacterium]HQM28891.1 DRTGG domain-containing protein [Syntrophales bacterium]